MPNAGALQKLEKVQNSTTAWFCGQVLDYGQTHEMSTSCGFTYDLEPSTHFQVSPITATRRNRSYIRQDFKNVLKTSLTAPAFPKTWKPTHWKNWNRNSKFPNYGLRAVSRGKIQRKVACTWWMLCLWRQLQPFGKLSPYLCRYFKAAQEQNWTSQLNREN